MFFIIFKKCHLKENMLVFKSMSFDKLLYLFPIFYCILHKYECTRHACMVDHQPLYYYFLVKTPFIILLICPNTKDERSFLERLKEI